MKLLAYILAAVSVLVLLPGLAAADNTVGEWAYSVNGSSATVTGYTGPGGDVTVPDTLGGLAVTAVGSNAFEGMAAIKTISLPAGITAIGAGAFRSCTGLIAVNLPGGVTVIEDETFRGCTSLADLRLPESLLGIGEAAFAGCSALTAVTIPKWVNNISARAFEGCSALAGVYFEGQPPAISTTAFNGTAASLLLYNHVTQTGWSGYADRPAKAYCTATLELMNGAAPTKTLITLVDGKVNPVPADPVRTGYQFGGWHKEAACLTKWDFGADIIGNDVVLYAKWTPVSCKVTFDSQGGSAVETATAPYGSILPAPAGPTRKDSFFGGWFKEPACTNAWSIATDVVQGDMTLYARWVVPAIPAEPTALSSSVSSIAVGWKASAYASGYEIYRSLSSKGKFALVATVYTNTFTDRKLSLGAPYYYKVKAFKQLETTRIYSAESVVVSSKPAPAAPADVKTGWRNSRSVRISWSAVEGAARYEVWRANTATGQFTLVKTVAGKYYTNNGLAEGKDYFYKVRAYAVVKGRKIYGQYSAVSHAQAAPVG